MTFVQDPPQPGHPWRDDPFLRGYLAHRLPPPVMAEVEPSLLEMAETAAGRLRRLLEAERGQEPVLVQWDAWGRRVDRIELTPLWKEAARVAAEQGVVATAHERRHGELSRIHQFALVHLFEPSSDVYSCPLAMTDGAVRTLVQLGNRELCERAVPRLTSRDPEKAWTSGQWMTERTGGSDVATSETVARQVDGSWRLWGTKWFTSAATSDMALTLARPEGNPPGGRGLAMFYLETHDASGGPNGILVHRLKEKLGTRKLPTAELALEGTLAVPVAGLTDGVKNITTMLNTTRTWNAVAAAAMSRRAVSLAADYARRRSAFGAPIAEKALHAATLADMEALAEGIFLLAFRAAELMGKEEARTLSEEEAKLSRLVVPIAKLLTGKQAVAVASEALEAIGGSAYVEDTGLPQLLRDAQVLPIWEGTTNVLSLDLLRALAKERAFDVLAAEVGRRTEAAPDEAARRAGEMARDAVAGAGAWLSAASTAGGAALEAGARRFAMTLGLALEVALLVEHGAFTLSRSGDDAPLRAASRLCRMGIDLVADPTAVPSVLPRR
ncbi:acyl-CoA dehydrogenase [Acidobacteria bacterium ACD]|nr:acyl-CoA dehydrogenase [Acidobacteria bacterium ACD]